MRLLSRPIGPGGPTCPYRGPADLLPLGEGLATRFSVHVQTWGWDFRSWAWGSWGNQSLGLLVAGAVYALMAMVTGILVLPEWPGLLALVVGALLWEIVVVYDRHMTRTLLVPFGQLVQWAMYGEPSLRRMAIRYDVTPKRRPVPVLQFDDPDDLAYNALLETAPERNATVYPSLWPRPAE